MARITIRPMMMSREEAQAIVDAVEDTTYSTCVPSGEEYQNALDDLEFYEHEDAQAQDAWDAWNGQ